MPRLSVINPYMKKFMIDYIAQGTLIERLGRKASESNGPMTYDSPAATNDRVIAAGFFLFM